MKKIFTFIGLLVLLGVAGGTSARWYRGGWGRPGVSFGIGFGTGYGWGGPWGGYWGGPGYWGSPYWGGYYSRPVYVYDRPSRPRSIQVSNNSNVTVTANGRTIQPGARITIRYEKFLDIQSSVGNVELQNPTGFIEVFQRSDGSLDADF